MRQDCYHRRLAARFTGPRLVCDVGTVFVPPQPVDLEQYAASYDLEGAEDDMGLTGFERLADQGCYQLVLSLTWGYSRTSSQTLDLGLLRTDGDKLFVVHQLNDDAGTSLILAYLAADTPSRLFGAFLIDYLSSRGTGYTVNLPCHLPQSIWIVRPEIVSQTAVAAGLLGLVSPGIVDWRSVQPFTGNGAQDAQHLLHQTSLMA